MGKIKVLDEDVSSKIAAGEIMRKTCFCSKRAYRRNSIDASAKKHNN